MDSVAISELMLDHSRAPEGRSSLETFLAIYRLNPIRNSVRRGEPAQTLASLIH